MKLTCSLPLVLFLLLVISQGVFSNPPSGNCCMSVAFPSQMSICAVTGSSVVISCSFKNPCNLTISKIYWGITTQDGKTPTDLKLNAAYQGCVQYFWNNDTDCTMKIQNVQKEDSSSYRLIFEIENPNKTREGKFEINFTVTDLTVLVPLPVIEGGDAKWLCMSVCNVTGDPKVIWRKNGQVLTGKQRNRHELELQNVSIKDEGFYSCGTASAWPTELSFGTCLTIGVSVSAAGVLVLVCVVNWISVKKRSGGHKKRDNGHLFTLQPQAPRESGRESDVQYTTVQFKRRESPETEGDDVQCASVQFKMAGVAQGIVESDRK
ncbi:uncharacterized protein LOC125297960 isoform X2 [Alosa alosa]|uniref:uncharacterized protein LOC125297960 isoform X2 n=1 Tax=Alosa alosa TaxID=278164 RepID=UPI002015398D|nr:uncharacterized protein LOC125297960 isoform X2 [Alosa alosa]